jgi:photosystem II stability/assembly factor-like uncharacterized protein
MKNHRCIITFLLVCFAFLSVCPLQAQQDSWQQISGPYGGIIHQVITGNSGCVCAATEFGGLYVSNDNGNHWTERIGERINCMAVNQDGKLFAGGAEGKLYTSTDDGINWISVSPPEFGGIWISAVTVDSSGRIYLGVSAKGLFRSDDDGESWVKITSGLAHSNPICLAAGPEGVIFAGFDIDGIYRTTDYGVNWSPMNNGLTSLEMRSIVITKSGYVLAATYGRGVFRSTIHGDSWVKVLDDFSFSLAIDNAGHIFHGCLGTISPDDPLGPGIYRSDDEGTTWVPINNGLRNLEVSSLAANAGNEIFAGTDGMGIFRSSNLGLSWEETNNGLDNMYIECLAGNSKNEIFAGGIGGGIQKSSDGGATWTRVAKELDPVIWDIAIDTSDRILVSVRGGAFMSTDNGENWEKLIIGIDGPKFAFSSNGKVVAAGPGGVWISDNTGANWVPSMIVEYPAFLFDVVVNESNYIFAGAFIDGLFISQDFGTSWNSIILDSTYRDVEKLFINANGSLFASAFADWATDLGCKVYRSDDNGATWTAVSNGLTNSPALSFAVDSTGCIYLGTMGTGVYRSSDNGQTWIPFNNGLKRKFISSLCIDRNGYLYAGTGGGDNFKKSSVKDYKIDPDLKEDHLNASNGSNLISGSYLFRIKTGVVSAVDISKPGSKNVTLEQNFPNPFSLNSIIRYKLTQPEDVSLKVYNSLGQLISILVNERKDIGTHEVMLDGTELPAGVYFYRLQTQKGILEKKFIISK